MMKCLLLSNEYPPHVYGGAGVHIEYLSRELSALMEVEVRCFGDQLAEGSSLKVRGVQADTSGYACPKNLVSLFGAVQRCVEFNTLGVDADVVHCHSWYTHLGGILAKLNYGVPLVVTVHSLEPLRPWKREQLGHGYDFSVWVEKTALEMADAVVAVSEGTRADVLEHFDVDPSRIHIIHNGIDTEEYHKVDTTGEVERFGIDFTRPYLLFVGRITRQKGIVHLVNALRHMRGDFQVVLCAGAPDTPEIAREMGDAVEAARAMRDEVFWIDEMVSKRAAIELYSHASLFCCPSIYEPFGIINLEAMACETAVVASAVGGIREVVVDGETGVLVPVEQMNEAPYEPVDPERFARDLAEAVNGLMADPERLARHAAAGRRRAVEHFGWASIAQRTRELYGGVVEGGED